VLPSWKPSWRPIYAIDKSYAENVAHGPEFTGQIPEREAVPESEWIDFLGVPIASRIGVPAGPLLTSAWTSLAGELGFDVLTYKSIRSHSFEGHPLPNVLYVSPKESTMLAETQTPQSLDQLSITNSFGMPSQGQKFLEEDIDKTHKSLKAGQALILSITGSESPKSSFFDDFCEVASFAKSTGAKIIEANFSCPNVSTGQGALYLDPKTVESLAKRLKTCLGSTPLIIKLGSFPTKQALERCLIAAAKGGVNAVCGINTLSSEVLNKEGEPALGINRRKSGICGAYIYPNALRFVEDARAVIDEHSLPMTLLGCGGISSPEHCKEMLSAGAEVALTATGMMWDPYLAARYHQNKKECIL
jgi:dihydroorotate dehydrogenase (NAD+) catalytic subunit